MALVRRFEDLEAWRQARSLAGAVYELIEESPLRRDFALSDRIKRAAISTMNNITEGFDSGSALEFRRFLRYAGRSASEVQSCLYVVLDRGYVTEVVFARVYRQAESVRRLCAALSRRLSTYTASSRDRGGRVRDCAGVYASLEQAGQFQVNRRPAHRRTGAPAHHAIGK